MDILKQLLEENKNILSKNDYNNILRMLREYETNNNIIIHNAKTKSCNNLCYILIDLLEEKKEVITDQLYIDSYNILNKLRFYHIHEKKQWKEMPYDELIWEKFDTFCTNNYRKT